MGTGRDGVCVCMCVCVRVCVRIFLSVFVLGGCLCASGTIVDMM